MSRASNKLSSRRLMTTISKYNKALLSTGSLKDLKYKSRLEKIILKYAPSSSLKIKKMPDSTYKF
jgi:hypothetical protein